MLNKVPNFKLSNKWPDTKIFLTGIGHAKDRAIHRDFKIPYILDSIIDFPNYDDIDNYIRQEIDGHEFIIEEAGYKIYEFFRNLCEPKHLSLIIYNNNNSFSTTYITIEE